MNCMKHETLFVWCNILINCNGTHAMLEEMEISWNIFNKTNLSCYSRKCLATSDVVPVFRRFKQENYNKLRVIYFLYTELQIYCAQYINEISVMQYVSSVCTLPNASYILIIFHTLFQCVSQKRWSVKHSFTHFSPFSWNVNVTMETWLSSKTGIL